MKQIINGYWGGYFDSQITLDKTPLYFNYVTLAFCNPNSDSTLITDFLCTKYDPQQIKTWIKELQNKGQKVLVSIIDSPTTHWDQVDIPKFAQSAKEILIDDWGVDGFDIDAESGMQNNYISNFILLITELKKVLNQKILTYTCYTGTDGPDGEILNHTKELISWINLMAYFISYEDYISLYQDYNKIIPNVTIGVKAGIEYTLLPEVKKLTLWNPNKFGMMLWTINRDTFSFTQNPNFTWSYEIYKYLS
jgi:chitinase